MRYLSTRDDSCSYSSTDSLLCGLPYEGGLFVPEDLPFLKGKDLEQLKDLSYPELCAHLLSYFYEEFSLEDLKEACANAYSEESFGEEPCRFFQLNRYNDKRYLMELWHGPTAAVQDFALQLYPFLLALARQKMGDSHRQLFLLANMGNEAQAAIEAMSKLERSRLLICYDSTAMSEVQRRQLLTGSVEGVELLEVQGEFDAIKRELMQVLSDCQLRQTCLEKGLRLSTLNSSNWALFVPHLAHYFYAYLTLLKLEKVELGAAVNFSIPSGSFGMILAAWYAGKMGLPIHKLICASNRNHVLSDFLQTGTYDIRRERFRTQASAMDSLIGFNFERLLYELSHQNGAYVVERMKQLREHGFFTVGPEMLNRLREQFVAGFTDDRGIQKTILESYDLYDTVLDPHTALAFNVYTRYERRSNDQHPVVYVSSSSPYKFVRRVLPALYPRRQDLPQDSLSQLQLLQKESDLPLSEKLTTCWEISPVASRKVRVEDLGRVVMERIQEEL